MHHNSHPLVKAQRLGGRISPDDINFSALHHQRKTIKTAYATTAWVIANIYLKWPFNCISHHVKWLAWHWWGVKLSFPVRYFSRRGWNGSRQASTPGEVGGPGHRRTTDQLHWCYLLWLNHFEQAIMCTFLSRLIQTPWWWDESPQKIPGGPQNPPCALQIRSLHFWRVCLCLEAGEGQWFLDNKDIDAIDWTTCLPRPETSWAFLEYHVSLHQHVAQHSVKETVHHLSRIIHMLRVILPRFSYIH